MVDIELLNYDPNTPSFYVILITALFAFFLSSIIAITYELTTKSIYRKAHFLQSLALIGVVAATVLQAIGDSVARGLGILGALSIIRFRTVLDDPRNITFMFASLAAGIACGVLGFTIALTGTIVFCIGALILSWSPLSNANELIGELKLHVPKSDNVQNEIERLLKPLCNNFELDQLRFLNPKKIEKLTNQGIPIREEISRENLQEFTYLIRLKEKSTLSQLTESMNQIEGLEDLRINFKKQPTKL